MAQILDPERMAYARALLTPPKAPDAAWPALAAALFFTVSALAFAFASVAAPPLTHTAIPAERQALE